MPKFAVDRVTYYRQRSTVIVEAENTWEAFAAAKREPDPEFDHEYLERVPIHDRLLGAEEVKE